MEDNAAHLRSKRNEEVKVNVLFRVLLHLKSVCFPRKTVIPFSVVKQTKRTSFEHSFSPRQPKAKRQGRRESYAGVTCRFDMFTNRKHLSELQECSLL